ncbi:MAG TPA: hypothetical protein VJ565_03095 [Dehalococcoidia bacterium]|nr:hypothetical protein [Dehalococcoidia bacterium]
MAVARTPKGVLLDGAQMTLMSLLVGTAGFLKERHIPISELVSHIGESFSESWGSLEGRGADEVMKHLLDLQILPLGVEVLSSELEPDKAEVVLTALPGKAVLEKFGTTPRDLLRGFGVDPQEVALIYGMFEPAAKAIGMRWTHQLKGGKQTLRLESKAATRKTGARRPARKS